MQMQDYVNNDKKAIGLSLEFSAKNLIQVQMAICKKRYVS